jgi:hypothetical protein
MLSTGGLINKCDLIYKGNLSVDTPLHFVMLNAFAAIGRTKRGTDETKYVSTRILTKHFNFPRLSDDMIFVTRRVL